MCDVAYTNRSIGSDWRSSYLNPIVIFTFDSCPHMFAWVKGNTIHYCLSFLEGEKFATSFSCIFLRSIPCDCIVQSSVNNFIIDSWSFNTWFF